MRCSNTSFMGDLYVNYIVLGLSDKTGASLLMVGTSLAHQEVVGLASWPSRTGGETQL